MYLVSRDSNFFWWDGILQDLISFGMELKHIFVPYKNLGTRLRHFLSQLHMRDGSEIDKFRPIPSHYRLRMKIFSIGIGSRRIPSPLGWDWDIFLSQKKYRDGILTFFHLIYIYGMGLRLINLIPSYPIANPIGKPQAVTYKRLVIPLGFDSLNGPYLGLLA